MCSVHGYEYQGSCKYNGVPRSTLTFNAYVITFARHRFHKKFLRNVVAGSRFRLQIYGDHYRGRNLGRRVDPIAEDRSESKQSGSIGGRKADRLPRELADVCRDVRWIIPQGTVRSENDDCPGRRGQYSLSCRPLKLSDVNEAIAEGESGSARQHPHLIRFLDRESWVWVPFCDGSRNSFGITSQPLANGPRRSELIRTDARQTEEAG